MPLDDARTMSALARAHRALCVFIIGCLLRLAIELDDHQHRVCGRVTRWRRRVRQLHFWWLDKLGRKQPLPFRRRNHPWNKTPDYIEEQVVRLHVEQPELGAGQLRLLSARVLGFLAARETFRQILIRRRELVVRLQAERRKKAAPHPCSATTNSVGR